MPISQDSPYRRAIDYGVFTVLIAVFVVAVVRRVRRPVVVNQDVAITQQAAPQPEATAAEPGAAPFRRHARLEPDRLPTPELESPDEPFPETTKGSGRESDRPPLSRQDVQIRMNPNTATWWELCELPGIGEVKARAIVAFREAFRAEARRENPRAALPPAFQKPEDLDQVKGIGPATVEKMRPMLIFDPPAGRFARER